jgi:hypothetical protein
MNAGIREMAVRMGVEDDDFPIAYLLYAVGAIVVIAVVALSSFLVFLR